MSSRPRGVSAFAPPIKPISTRRPPTARLARFFDLLCKHGPKFGYFPEPVKSILVVRPEWKGRAREVFGTRFKISCGERYLGGFVGTRPEETAWLSEKVDAWVEGVSLLARVASQYP